MPLVGAVFLGLPGRFRARGQGLFLREGERGLDLPGEDEVAELEHAPQALAPDAEFPLVSPRGHLLDLSQGRSHPVDAGCEVVVLVQAVPAGNHGHPDLLLAELVLEVVGEIIPQDQPVVLHVGVGAVAEDVGDQPTEHPPLVVDVDPDRHDASPSHPLIGLDFSSSSVAGMRTGLSPPSHRGRFRDREV